LKPEECILTPCRGARCFHWEDKSS